jgi:DNA-binding MarR family transcriptional regulator
MPGPKPRAEAGERPVNGRLCGQLIAQATITLEIGPWPRTRDGSRPPTARACSRQAEMWTVLTRLMARDGQYQSELAAGTYRDRPNMSRILAGMEQRDLVVRRPDADDRRKTRIHLTPAARQLVAATAPVAIRTRDRLYDGLKKKELKALRRALRIIEANTLSALQDLESEAPPE